MRYLRVVLEHRRHENQPLDALDLIQKQIERDESREYLYLQHSLSGLIVLDQAPFDVRILFDSFGNHPVL